MFLIRRAMMDDVPALMKLARTVHFINLPPEKDILDDRVSWSRACFLLAAESAASTTPPAAPKKRAAKSAVAPTDSQNLAGSLQHMSGRTPLFMFVLEDTEAQSVVGTAQVISRMGGPGFPNVSLQLESKDLFSTSLQTGVRHTLARLHLDETSPTEIGGLILQHSLRGHKQKLGRFLSLIRFQFMAMHRALFSPRVLAEMMGVINPAGASPFWDHCTRAFINLTYEQADRFCQQNKEFLLTLFPREPLYLTLLPPQARAVVGQVGPETVPARKMLEALGFTFHNRVDPFDAGPHLEAALDDLEPVRTTVSTRLGAPLKDDAAARAPLAGMVSVLPEDGEFRAVQCPYALDKAGRVQVTRSVLDALGAEPGQPCGYTPIATGAPRESPRAGKAAASEPPRRAPRAASKV